MGFDERLFYLLLGCVIGFVVGYILRSLRDIKDELDEVEDIVKHKDRNEDGFVRIPFVADIILLLVVIMTIWAAFASQKAANEVEANQVTIERITDCNQKYLEQTANALSERTASSAERSQANIELQKAQSKFLGVLLKKPPVSQEEREDALEGYFRALTAFIETNGDYKSKAAKYEYPTKEDIQSCLEKE